MFKLLKAVAQIFAASQTKKQTHLLSPTELWAHLEADILTCNNCNDVAKILLNQGWEQVKKHSSFANVYISPCGEYALRVGKHFLDKHSYHAQNALCNAGNPYFPVVHQHVHSIYSRLSITLMEALNETKPSQKAEINRLCTALPDTHALTFTAHHLDHNNPVQVNAVKSCYDIMKTYDLRSDFNPRNIMRRGCKQLVITDPFL